MTADFTDSYNDGTLQYRVCTHTTANPAVFLRKNHGLVANDRVQFETDNTMPTGIAVDTWYFVITTGLTEDEFEIATTKGGSGVAITVAGSGQLFFAPDKTMRLRVSSSSSDSCK